MSWIDFPLADLNIFSYWGHSKLAISPTDTIYTGRIDSAIRMPDSLAWDLKEMPSSRPHQTMTVSTYESQNILDLVKGCYRLWVQTMTKWFLGHLIASSNSMNWLDYSLSSRRELFCPAIGQCTQTPLSWFSCGVNAWNFTNNANPLNPLLRKKSTPISAGGVVFHIHALNTVGHFHCDQTVPLTVWAHVTTGSSEHVRVEQDKKYLQQ